MTSIRIRIPRTNKEWIYIGEQEVNAARSAGNTTGMAYAKAGVYKSLRPEDGKKVCDSDVLCTSGTSEMSNVQSTFVVGHRHVGNVWLKGEDYSIEILDAVVDVTKKNTIKETALVHRDGTVKELIQANDYEVTITGHLFSDSKIPSDAKFPTQALSYFNKLLSVKEPIEISSIYTTDCLGIRYVVLKSADFKQSTNKSLNVFEFKLTMVSDTEHTFMED